MVKLILPFLWQLILLSLEISKQLVLLMANVFFFGDAAVLAPVADEVDVTAFFGFFVPVFGFFAAVFDLPLADFFFSAPNLNEPAAPMPFACFNVPLFSPAFNAYLR